MPTCDNTELSCGYDRCHLTVRANEPRNNHRPVTPFGTLLVITDTAA
jgi:hypothetical protein